MTFLEAFTKYGPDVERIAEALGITPPEADRLINAEMTGRYIQRRKDQISKYKRQVSACENMRRVRSELREIRRRPA